MSEPRVPGNLLSEHRYRHIRRNACPSHMFAIQTLSRANDPYWRPRSAPFAMPDRILAAPRGPGDSRRGQRSAFTIPDSSAVPGGSNRRRTSPLDISGDLMAAPRAQAMGDSRGNYRRLRVSASEGLPWGGTTLVARNGPKRSPNRRFPEGAGPAPPAGIPAPPEHADWPHGTRFRVLLGATLLPDGCPVGVRRQVWTGRGG